MTPADRARLTGLQPELAAVNQSLARVEAAIRARADGDVHAAVDTNGRRILADVLVARAGVLVALVDVARALADDHRATEVLGHDGTVLRTLPDDTGTGR